MLNFSLQKQDIDEIWLPKLNIMQVAPEAPAPSPIPAAQPITASKIRKAVLQPTAGVTTPPPSNAPSPPAFSSTGLAGG